MPRSWYLTNLHVLCFWYAYRSVLIFGSYVWVFYGCLCSSDSTVGPWSSQQLQPCDSLVRWAWLEIKKAKNLRKIKEKHVFHVESWFSKGFAMFSMTILVFLSFCNDFQIISWFSLDFVVIFIEIPVFTKKLWKDPVWPFLYFNHVLTKF